MSVALSELLLAIAIAIALIGAGCVVSHRNAIARKRKLGHSITELKGDGLKMVDLQNRKR